MNSFSRGGGGRRGRHARRHIAVGAGIGMIFGSALGAAASGLVLGAALGWIRVLNLPAE